MEISSGSLGGSTNNNHGFIDFAISPGDMRVDNYTDKGDMPSDLNINGEGPFGYYDSESDLVIVCECIYTNNDDWDDIYKYDADTNNWGYVGDKPSGLNAQYGGVVYDSESDLGIFIEMGDIGACGGSDCDDIWAYDYNSNTWTKKMDHDINAQYASRFYDSQNDIIIIASANTGASGSQVWAYDVNSNTMTQKGNSPSGGIPGRGLAYYDSESGRGIIAERSTGDGLDVYAYDYKTDTWTQMADRPNVDFEGGGFYYDEESDRGVIFQRGQNSNWKSVYSYDYNTDTWLQLSDQPSGLRLQDAGFATYDSDSNIAVLIETSDEVYHYDHGDSTPEVIITATGGVGTGSEGDSPDWSYTTSGDIESGAVDISSSGEYVVVGSKDDKVYLFDKDSNTALWSYTTGGDVSAVSISENGDYIAAGSDDDKIYLFHKDSSIPLWSYTSPGDVVSIAISGNGEYVAAGTHPPGGAGKLYLFDNGGNLHWDTQIAGGSEGVISISFSNDGEFLVAGSHNNKVYYFDKDSSTEIWSYTTAGNVYSVAMSSDGEYIAVGTENDKIYLFDKDSSTPSWIYTTDDHVYSVSISADGEYIVGGSNDDKLYLFDKDSSTPSWSYSTSGDVNSVSISDDGQYVTAASSSNKVYFFDKDSGTPLWSYSLSSNDFTAVSISADGKHIIAGSDDDKAYKFTTIWDPGLMFGSSGHLYDDNSPYDNAINIDIADEFTAVPEFSSILFPIASVIMIVGFNYRRRVSLDA